MIENITERPENIKKLNFPWRITFDTNPDDCNYSCIMCEEFSEFSSIKELHIDQGLPKKRRMDVVLLNELINEQSKDKGLQEIIPSTMGEPTLYKNFPLILDLCKKNNIKLNLTTNGSFSKIHGFNSVKEWAEAIVPVTSDVKISWNGVTKETQEKIMKGSNFEKGLKAIKDFISIRDEIFNNGGNFCRVTLQVTFMEDNYKEFPELVKLASELGVNRIKGHHLWAHFNEIKDQSMRRNKGSIKRWNDIVKEMQRMRNQYPLQNGEKVLLDNVYELDVDESDKHVQPEWACPFLGNEAWIAWDGRFNPCCAPDEQRKTLGYFGNIKDKSILEIWNSKEYNDLVQNYWQRPLCQNCNMRRPLEDTK